jgi:hypothetical protein
LWCFFNYYIYAALQRNSDRNSDDESFIQQVVYGWYRQKAGLNAFITNFYADNAAAVTRADNLLYTVMAYLAVFRLEDMGFPRFREIVLSQDSTKMVTMLSYLFNEVSYCYFCYILRYFRNLSGTCRKICGRACGQNG